MPFSRRKIWAERVVLRAQPIQRCLVSITVLTTELGRNPVKLVRLVKKALPKKSLKAYAWYGWI
ncbi:tryptorubin family RiPP precursor [Amycolatopsis sp. NPDC051758]|uniref:tryptorubin family RiPP precursor n=1 Tax=Amycolatopsis sp. NPDC051758 TaxID=3363935 RepID=UPI0037AD8A86